MDNWITFWKYICLIGFGSYIISVLFIIPFGARDIFRLFKELGRNRDSKGTRKKIQDTRYKIQDTRYK